MQPINVDVFLKRFEHEKQNNVIVKASDGKEEDYPKLDHKIGEILDPNPQRKKEIMISFEDLMKTGSHIHILTLH